jgi:hypothetical protein
MYEENVYEAKVKQLMTEFREVTEELMKKECYYDGLAKNICKQAKHYYDTYDGRWSHLYFDNNFIDNAEVRVAEIRVKFYGNILSVIVTVAVNPSDLRNDLQLNGKEKKLMAKAKRLWKNDAGYSHMYDLEEYEQISNELMDQEHEVVLVDEKNYNFTELELMNGQNICVSNLIIGKCNGTNILLNMFEVKEND